MCPHRTNYFTVFLLSKGLQMKINDDVPIGECITHKNKTYIVVAQFGCKFCAFNYKKTDWCIDKDTKCYRNERADRTDAIYLRIA